MRTFTLISSWLFWVLCAFYAFAVFFIRATGKLVAEPHDLEKLADYTKWMWMILGMFTVLTACVYVLRRHFWFQKKQAVGFGFWLLTMIFYLLALAVTVSGFAPYFQGDRSAIQWASCALGLTFLILGFPRLPRWENEKAALIP